MRSLRKELKTTLRSAYSKGTYSNLRTQFTDFLLFCAYFKFTPLPAELDTVCLYVQLLSRTLSPPSVRNYLSGVKLLHLFSGLEYSFSREFVLSLELRGIARVAHHTPQRAPPVTPEILLRVSQQINYLHDPIDCTLFCAYLFCFFLMARLGNLVTSASSFDPSRDLTRGDVIVNDQGLIVTFKHTKTIQFGERIFHIPLLYFPQSPLCPVAAYYRMTKLVPADSRAPLFSLPSRLGPFSLSQEF